MNKLINSYKNQLKFYNSSSYMIKVLLNVIPLYIAIFIQQLLLKNLGGMLLFLVLFLLYIALFLMISYLIYRLGKK